MITGISQIIFLTRKAKKLTKANFQGPVALGLHAFFLVTDWSRLNAY